MKNQKLIWVVLISAFIIVTEVSFFEKRRAFSKDPVSDKANNETSKRSIQSEVNLTSSKSNSPENQSTNNTNETQYKREVHRIGLVDEHPEQTEIQLKLIADSMKLSELKELKSKALNTNLNGDDRMLSIYLLSLSQHPTVSSLLEEIVISPIHISAAGENARQYDFENALRSQAIEGLQNRNNKAQAIKSLSTLISKITDSNLLDRSQRALSHHKHGTPTLEQQDLEALKKIVR